MFNIDEYISENEPTLIEKDDAGRWSRRIWQLEDGTHIVESYQYIHPVDSNNRQLFKVKNVTLEHQTIEL